MSEKKPSIKKESDRIKRAHEHVRRPNVMDNGFEWVWKSLQDTKLRVIEAEDGTLSFDTRTIDLDEKDEPRGHNRGPALDDEPWADQSISPQVAKAMAARKAKDRSAHSVAHIPLNDPEPLLEPLNEERSDPSKPETSFLDALAELSASTSELVQSWIAPKAQVADTFLLFVCTPDDAEASVGDLMEAYDAVAARKSASISNVWFAWELSLLVVAKGRKRIVKAILGPLLDRILKGKAG